MLRLADGTLVLAATDLTNHLACPHLSQQRRAIALGERAKPRPIDDPHGDLIRDRGEAHEREQLDRLSAECGGHVDLSSDVSPYTREDLQAAAAQTTEAMREGAPLIYQAQFFDGRWQGRADFLRRLPAPSDLGNHAYEVLDTKLARQVKPQVVHQLSLYSRLLGDVQGFHPPFAYVVLGDGRTEQVVLGRYAALHRHVVRQVEAVLLGDALATYPEPVAHCAICALSFECETRRRADDHLSLVAFARRDQREKLVDLRLGTVAELAAAPIELDPGPLGHNAYDVLHHQAALQVEARETKHPTRRHLPPVAGMGYARMPDASAGDVFFDLEGDPYVGTDGGIEYLWGWWVQDRYECVWAHDKAAEKVALESFVDTVCALRVQHPGMHVFHYAPHEASKLRSLSVEHATREAEVDDLLRHDVLVDLYAVVRQGVQVGEESYSLKKLERHHGFRRLETTVREGGGSIIAYETWLETGAAELLEAIRAYNEEDCRSTLSLRDWLLNDLRPEAELEFALDFRDLVPEEEDVLPEPAWLPDVNALIGRLELGLPTDPGDDDTGQAERRLLAHLLLYHRRESKPEWWRHFELLDMTLVELEYERDALSGLVRMHDVEPIPYKRSLDYAFTFPPQEFKLDLGKVLDQQTGETHTLVAIEDDRIYLRRGKGAPPPSPAALVPTKPIDGGPLRKALVAFATELADGGNASAAARSILRREPPQLRAVGLAPDTDSLISATIGLVESNLPVQGPPGTGKTFLGARMVVAAMQAGMRVAVTAFSHAAIQNFLHMIEEHAGDIGFEFAGMYKGHGYASRFGLVDTCEDNKDTDGDFALVAGTAWLFARPEHRKRFARLFIDEAGQFSLANAIAVAAVAESVVMLGDPQQLPQVTKADHPDGSGASVLEHLLAGRSTIADGRGVLLDVSWRMHPDVCAFVSERSYDNLLRSRAACANRRVDATGPLSGAGLRVRFVDHDGRSQASVEEAEAIAEDCRTLLAGGRVTDADGIERGLKGDDIIVVAPYNLARRCIGERVPPGVRVGTVDKFQGQEAAVVFFAMTCSSGEEVPRGLDFLFDRNRFNVAVSRAQCLAVVVVNPRLLDADCRTLESMQLVDGACRFVEMAAPVNQLEDILLGTG
jgi:predicted RecB family nuclease